jgi:hypothetical protein
MEARNGRWLSGLAQEGWSRRLRCVNKDLNHSSLSALEKGRTSVPDLLSGPML